MGCWSTEIMGGDWPMDVEHLFRQRFDERVPTADESRQFLLDNVGKWGSDEAPATKQVVAFLLIQLAAPMHDDVRQMALEGCAEEDTSCWKNPAERAKVLEDFAETVKAYPAEGGKVKLPHQPGLFEMFMNKREPLEDSGLAELEHGKLAPLEDLPELSEDQ